MMTMSREPVKTKDKTILIVEDSDDLRSDVIEMLNMEGYATCGAENGNVGVEVARKVMPDLIVCDIMMPELDGYGVLQQLRADTGTAVIPFIFLTAKTEHIDRRHGMVLGADDFLTKPFLAEELLESIEVQLKKREDQLEAVRRRIKELTGSIAQALPHELRTPLNTIIGFSEMLQSEAQNLKPDQVAGWAGHVHSAGYRLYDVVENYLLYVRLKILIEENVKAEESFITSDLHFTIQARADSVAGEYNRNADTVVEVEAAPDLLIKEEHAIKLIEELLDNAFKFSQNGQAVNVRGYNEDNAYVLVIEDKGRGMSAKQINEIDAFMQFERSHYEQQGLGLGLALVKQISNIYDVDFAPIGEKEKGITVTVRFKKK